MIGAGDIQESGAADPVFLRQTDRDFDLGSLARDDDLARAN